MSDISIFRPATEDEKNDFIEITKSKKSVMNQFLGRLANKHLDYQRKHVPFCSHCARLDFDKKMQDLLVDSVATEASKMNKKHNEENLDQYAGLDKFELISSNVIKEAKLLDGLRTTAIIGKRFTFKCKNRGCGLIMDIENEDLEEALKILEPNKEVVSDKKEDKKEGDEK